MPSKMETEDWLELVRHLTSQCSALGRELAAVKQLHNDSQHVVENLADQIQEYLSDSEPQPDRYSCFLNELAKLYPLDEHEVVSLTNTNEDIFLRKIRNTLHELATIKSSHSTLRSALNDRF